LSDHDFTLTSGNLLHVSSSSFEDANSLMKALMKSAKGKAIGDDPLKQDLSVLKDVFIDAVVSDDVERALFKCLERASYQSVKVTKALFDDPGLGEKARGDMFEMYWKCVEVNCGPFFVKIFSVFKDRLKSVGGTQKSPSPQMTAL